MKAIELANKDYKGDWPISHWCYTMVEEENYPPKAKVHVFDRHTNEPDFIVPHMGKQAEWYKKARKRVLDV